MQPIEVSFLKAFILALYHLDAPLPDAVQAQINTINIPDDIRELDAIAKKHTPLATSYEQVWKSLNAIASIRSKGIDSLPQPLPNSLDTEIDNSSRKVEDALIVFDQKVDSNQLADISRQIFQALNSVKTARDIIQTILF